MQDKEHNLMSNVIKLNDYRKKEDNHCEHDKQLNDLREHDKQLNDLLARAEPYMRDKRLMPEELFKEMEEFAKKYID